MSVNKNKYLRKEKPGSLGTYLWGGWDKRKQAHKIRKLYCVLEGDKTSSNKVTRARRKFGVSGRKRTLERRPEVNLGTSSKSVPGRKQSQYQAHKAGSCLMGEHHEGMDGGATMRRQRLKQGGEGECSEYGKAGEAGRGQPSHGFGLLPHVMWGAMSGQRETMLWLGFWNTWVLYGGGGGDICSRRAVEAGKRVGRLCNRPGQEGVWCLNLGAFFLYKLGGGGQKWSLGKITWRVKGRVRTTIPTSFIRQTTTEHLLYTCVYTTPEAAWQRDWKISACWTAPNHPGQPTCCTWVGPVTCF